MSYFRKHRFSLALGLLDRQVGAGEGGSTSQLVSDRLTYIKSHALIVGVLYDCKISSLLRDVFILAGFPYSASHNNPPPLGPGGGVGQNLFVRVRVGMEFWR